MINHYLKMTTIKNILYGTSKIKNSTSRFALDFSFIYFLIIYYEIPRG